MEGKMKDNVSALARDWLDAKSEETAANKKRLIIEKQLTQALDAKSEASITHEIEGYKVTLTQPVTRKLDPKMWDMVAKDCPKGVEPIKTKMEADPAGMKWLAENMPEVWRKIAPAFETKPGKVGVKVVEVTE
jgi:hypothetical protein